MPKLLPFGLCCDFGNGWKKMTKTKCCTIRLLNKSYDIKCPEQEQQSLQLAAQKLNELLLKSKTQFKTLDNVQVLVLAALHLSHELITSQSQQKEQRHQLTEFISNLENKIGLVANNTTQTTVITENV